MNLKVKNPLKDVSFYAALIPIIIALAPHSVREWVQENPESLAPMVIWLTQHGLLRGRAMKLEAER